SEVRESGEVALFRRFWIATETSLLLTESVLCFSFVVSTPARSFVVGSDNWSWQLRTMNAKRNEIKNGAAA
ncbi:hypothetical protein, partial [Duncaniella dubosii]|uniref:hypothetical protein n=1 Tax=Duncaniella dubosii TaxID=2518971 RepID=UPI0023F4C568